jgi:aldehyde dehydrogenase (NAD+)
LAAKRIVFGKFLNCGQTCVAPDYILCHENVKEELVRELKKQIEQQYGANPLENPDYGRIINRKHFDRLIALIDPEKTVYGGNQKERTLQISPTLLDGITWADPVVQEEIFGPILPILTYGDLNQVLEMLANKPKPLALYIFSEDRSVIREVTRRCRYGGGCINDCVVHLATAMAFGGVGESGMGAYHGKTGFDTFSHTKSILEKKTWLDLPMRYQPYNRKRYGKFIRLFLK